MKNIVKFAVSNPVTICMVVLAILLLGKISYDQLSVDLLPDLNNPRLFIELKGRRASAGRDREAVCEEHGVDGYPPERCHAGFVGC